MANASAQHAAGDRGSIGRRRIRWGVLGTGLTTYRFASAAAALAHAEIAAVASRSLDHAQAWAAAHHTPGVYSSCEALLDDAEVDIVYVATPAEQHHAHCTRALSAGKAVLCEKPFAMNAAQARDIAAAAARSGRFCMEAMWLRFSPLVQRARERIRSGALGQIDQFHAVAGYRAAPARLQQARPGHGALLNFGVYAVSLAHFLFGRPSGVQAAMLAHAGGLDESFAALLRYPALLGTVSASIGATTSNEAVIAGESGSLRIGSPFFDPGWLRELRAAMPASPAPGRMRELADQIPGGSLLQGNFAIALLRGNGRLSIRPRGADTFRLQVEEAMRCLEAGEPESPLMPLAESVAVMETLDAIRLAWARPD